MIIFIRSFCFNILFYGLTAIVGFILLPFLISKTATKKISFYWAKTSIYLLKTIIGVNFCLKGIQNIPQSEGSLFIANHQSAIDTILFVTVFKDPCYVLKAELTKIPIYGWFVRRSGHIAINRKGRVKTLNYMIKAVAKKISKGSQVVIFPEGTRAKFEETVSFKRGISVLAEKTGSKIYPTVILSGHIWASNAFYKFPGNVIVEILDPIKMKSSRKDFEKLLEYRVVNGLKKLKTSLPRN